MPNKFFCYILLGFVSDSKVVPIKCVIFIQKHTSFKVSYSIMANMIVIIQKIHIRVKIFN